MLVLLVRDTLGNPVAGGVVFLLRPGHFLLNTVVVHQDFRNQGLGRFVTCTLLEEHSRLAESISDGNSNEGGEVIVGDVFFSLIATPLGIPVYSRIGFRSSPNYAVHLFELRSVSNSSSAAAVPATNLKATSGNVHYVADQHGDRTNCFETPAYDDSGGNDGEGANTQLDCTIIHACEVATAHTENDTSPSGKALLQAAIHYYDQVVNPPACAEQSDARVAALANHSHEDTARVAVVTRRGEKYKVVAAAWLYTHAANTTRQSNKNETGAFLGPVVGDSIGAARIAVAEVLDGLREDCLKQEGGETAVIVTMLALDRPSERECERMWNGMGLEYVVELPYMTMTMSEKEGDDSNAKQDEIGCCDTDRYFCIRGYM